VPAVVAKATAELAGAVVGSPFASRSCRVIVEVEVPFARIVVGVAVSVEAAGDGGLATKVTVADLVSERPSTLADTVAEPAAFADVSSAVKAPPPAVWTGPSDPAVVAIDTACPSEVRGFPFASIRSTVMSDVDVPSAGIDVGAAVMVDLWGDGRGRTRTSTATLWGELIADGL
jgi:hypothetical protein